MKIQENIVKLLATTGYKGDCLELEHLNYAVRVGACSWQYLELLDWLERQTQMTSKSVDSLSRTVVQADFAPLFRRLRESYLKISSGSSTDPTEFRWKMLEYLMKMLNTALEKNSKGCSSAVNVQKHVALNATQSIRLQKEAVAFRNKPTEDINQNINAKFVRCNKNENVDESWDTARGVQASVDNAKQWFVIIKENSPTGEISNAEWLKLKGELIEHFKEVPCKQKPIASSINCICFDQPKHRNQLRIVVCKNSRSAKFLREVVHRLPKERKITVVPCIEIAKLFVITAWVWIGQKYEDNSIILDLISLHNSLCTDDWRVIKTGPVEGNGFHYLLELGRSALPVLQRSGGYLNFGERSIYLRLNKELRSNFDFDSLEMKTYIRKF